MSFDHNFIFNRLLQIKTVAVERFGKVCIFKFLSDRVTIFVSTDVKYLVRTQNR